MSLGKSDGKDLDKSEDSFDKDHPSKRFPTLSDDEMMPDIDDYK